MTLLRGNPTDPAVREIALAAWKRAKHQHDPLWMNPRERPVLDSDARRMLRNKRKKRKG